MVTDEGRWWASLLYHASRVLQHLVIELSLGLLDTITSVQLHNRVFVDEWNGALLQFKQLQNIEIYWTGINATMVLR